MPLSFPRLFLLGSGALHQSLNGASTKPPDEVRTNSIVFPPPGKNTGAAVVPHEGPSSVSRRATRRGPDAIDVFPPPGNTGRRGTA